MAQSLLCPLALVLTVLVVGGCAAIPTDSSPRPLGTLGRQRMTTSVPRPESGMTPESLVRAFLKASADPTGRHAAAREFLTPAAAAGWNDQGAATILSDINVLSDNRTDRQLTVQVSGRLIGQLAPDGQLTAQSGTSTSTLALVRSGEDWRIDGALPSGAIMDASQFSASYVTHNLYFADPADHRLVVDPRWLYVGTSPPADMLLSMLIQGPDPSLTGAVTNEFPAGATLRRPTEAISGGGIRIDLSEVADADRTLLAAQIVWTLSGAGIAGPYEINVDGSPLDGQYASGWRTTDLAQFDPNAGPDPSIGLHAVAGGAFGTVRDGRITPIPGEFGTTHSLVSAQLSRSGKRIAAVTQEGPAPAPQHLLVGPYGGYGSVVAEGPAMSRPSFGVGDDTVWIVLGGNDIRRMTVDASGGSTRVDSIDPGTIHGLISGPITELQLSPDGSRVALIVGGKIVLAVVNRQPSGAVSIGAARLMAPAINSSALSLSWQTPTQLVVALDSADEAVETISIDGSQPIALPTGNLTPPVRAIVASSGTVYAADARAMQRLDFATTQQDQYWTEVAGTAGATAIPVLPS